MGALSLGLTVLPPHWPHSPAPPPVMLIFRLRTRSTTRARQHDFSFGSTNQMWSCVFQIFPSTSTYFIPNVSWTAHLKPSFNTLAASMTANGFPLDMQLWVAFVWTSRKFRLFFKMHRWWVGIAPVSRVDISKCCKTLYPGVSKREQLRILWLYFLTNV